MRQFLSVILFLVFSVQLLPLESIGKLLYSQTLQEEVPHSDDKPVEKTGKGLEVYHVHCTHNMIIENLSYQQAKHLHIHPREFLTPAHWLETFSPPPETA